MNAARLLIVEDDPSLALFLKETLVGLGYSEINIATTGEQAVNSALAYKPNAILIEARLPGDLSGVQAVQLIHQQIDVPVIFLTAYTDESLLQQAKFSGASAYLSKPVREREVAAILDLVLSKHASDRRLQHLNQVLRSVRDINQLITHEHHSQRLLESSCQILVRTRGYRFVWIGIMSGTELEPTAFAGEGKRFIDKIGAAPNRELRKSLPGMQALATRQPIVCHDMLQADYFASWRDEVERAQFQSTVSVPMQHNGNLFGILNVYADQTNIFDKEEVDLLVELASDLAFGLKTIEEQAERKRVEQALSESQERFRLAIEASGAVPYRHDFMTDTYTFIGEGIFALTGYTAQEMTPALYGSLEREIEMMGETAQLDPKTAGKFMKEGLITQWHCDSRIVRRDGETRWIADASTLIRNEQGKAIGSIGFLQDITERKRAEQALYESEEKFRSLIEQSSEGVLLIDENGDVIEFNKAGETLTGVKRQDVLGLPYTNLVMRLLPPERRTLQLLEQIQAQLKQAQSTGKSPVFEHLIERDLPNENRFIQQTLFPIKTEKGYRLASLTRDVTEHKRAEQALRESEERFRSFVEHTSEWIFMTDEQGIVVQWNRAGEVMTWLPREEVIGKPVWDVQFRLVSEAHRTPEMYNRIKSVFLETLMTGSSEIVSRVREHQFNRADGVPQVVEQYLFTIKTAKGYWLMGVSRDITAPKRAEAELLKRSQQLEALRQISLELTVELELDVLLQSIAQRAIPLIQAETCSCYLLREERQELERVVLIGGFANPQNKPTRKRGEGLIGKVWERGEPILVNDYQKWGEGRPVYSGLEPRAVMGVPIRRGEKFLGVLTLTAKVPRTFSRSELELVSLFADQAAIAIQNAWLFEQAQQELAERKRAEAEIRHRIEQIETLHQSALHIQQQLDPDRIYTAACAELRHFGSFASVFKVREDGWIEHSYSSMDDESLRSYVERFGDRSLNFALPLATMPGGADVWLSSVNILNTAELPGLLANTTPEIRDVADWLQAQSHQSPMMFAPLTHGDKTVGLFAVVEKSLGKADIPAIALFARQVSTALENAHVFAAEQARRTELSALYNLASSLVNTDALNEVLGRVLNHAIQTIHVTFARIALLENDRFVIYATRPIRIRNSSAQFVDLQFSNRLDLSPEILGQMDLIPLAVDDEALTSQDRQALFLGVAKSVYLIPLRAGNLLIGVLILGEVRNSVREPFGEEKQRLARSMGDQAAGAIRRAILHTQTQQDAVQLSNAYEATIEGWSRALDLRDKETEGHTQRVAEMTTRLARLYGFAEDRLSHIRRGALLHDIGKMAISDTILLKPGAFTEQEWQVVRRHPDYARMFLASIEYLVPALDIPYCHHEKWDGTGYPRGLKGEQIPLDARLFAIVDVWDAMTMNRPYRAAISPEHALKHIRSQSGMHFDPRVVKLFVEMLKME
ncbi:MAG: GAF domain-containing protein [Chloroflexi bacterium]|nr:GAF domain-containing protein [Chloroflexota bacterium]